jgi:hypothetical protein
MHAAGVLLALLTLVGQGTPVTKNPFVGSWTANLSKSRLSPDFPYRSATLQIAVAGDTVTMASVVVDASGKEQRVAETFRSDGTETPGTLTPGVTHIARWVGSHVLASIAKKNGEVFALMTYQVSSDGKTLTTRSSGTLEQIVVFDRN